VEAPRRSVQRSQEETPGICGSLSGMKDLLVLTIFPHVAILFVFSPTGTTVHAYRETV